MFDLIQDDLAAFEEALPRELESSVAFIEAIGDNLVSAGGKRLRPSLAFLAGKLLNVKRESAMQVALTVELLHSASLLHDDLIDDAETRRGSEAAFRRYGNVVSVMSGDYMLAKMFGILADAHSSELIRLISHTAADICEGEVLQFQMATLETYSFENYFKVIEGKTAVLFAAALEGVAMLTDTSAEQREALRTFGMSYGRAFQMRDDYLDLLGDEAQIGKPIGGDLREGKATYPILLLFEKGVDEARRIVQRHARGDTDIPRMIDLVREHGSDEATIAGINKEIEAAVTALNAFPDSDVKAQLVGLAQRESVRVK